jgi:hypothetical protein
VRGTCVLRDIVEGLEHAEVDAGLDVPVELNKPAAQGPWVSSPWVDLGSNPGRSFRNVTEVVVNGLDDGSLVPRKGVRRLWF